jgi:superfamily II DNA or RNA helicase
MKVHYLEGNGMTAHDLLALGMDVVVVSYEQVEAYERDMRMLQARIDDYTLGRTTKKPSRPVSILHSSFWDHLNLKIKRLVLDEVHLVNKRNGIRHQALKRLPYEAVIGLTGTMAHNVWHNTSGIIDFGIDHPFPTHQDYMRIFATSGYDGKLERPSISKMRMLQRFLQAVTICRPASIIQLPPCTRVRSYFQLSNAAKLEVDHLATKYLQLAVMNEDRAIMFDDGSKRAECLSFAVMAQLYSLHPMLAEKKIEHLPASDAKDIAQMDLSNAVYGIISADAATRPGAERNIWLKDVQNREKLISESNRVTRFLQVYQEIRSEHPSEKIIVFSQYLKFLDIIAEALRRCYNVEALRFDGKVSNRDRLGVQEQFKVSDPSVPLLITAGAGSSGLNITTGSIIIILEVWWNKNVERQAIARAYRQLQTKAVLVVQLFATNSSIELEMARVQLSKDIITAELMAPLIRSPDEDPLILPLLLDENLPVEVFRLEKYLDQAEDINITPDEDGVVKAEDDDDDLSLPPLSNADEFSPDEDGVVKAEDDDDDLSLPPLSNADEFSPDEDGVVKAEDDDDDLSLPPPSDAYEFYDEDRGAGTEDDDHMNLSSPSNADEFYDEDRGVGTEDDDEPYMRGIVLDSMRGDGPPTQRNEDRFDNDEDEDAADRKGKSTGQSDSSKHATTRETVK